MDELKKQIEIYNNKIIELKAIIKKYYNKDINDINVYTINAQDNLEEIIEKQIKDISKLNFIVDQEDQILGNKRKKKIEELKEKELDKEFSKFYREGIIEVNNIEVSVNKFYIKELKSKDEKTFYNFICTDKRIDKKVFGTLEDRELKVLNIYKLKDSVLFYKMYLDKDLYNDNKIVLNDYNKIKTFMNYIHTWTKEKHSMVAETMI